MLRVRLDTVITGSGDSGFEVTILIHDVVCASGGRQPDLRSAVESAIRGVRRQPGPMQDLALGALDALLKIAPREADGAVHGSPKGSA